jgi:signal transduction histidine kinase
MEAPSFSHLMPEIVEKIPVGIAAFRCSDLHLVWCNTAFLKQRKTPANRAKEEIGKELVSLFFDEHKDVILLNAEIALKQGFAYDFGRNLKGFRGSASHVEYWLYPVAAASEEPLICLLTKDYSLQRLHDELTQKQAQIEQILSSMNEGLFEVNSEFRVGDVASNAAKQIFGKSDIKGTDIKDLFVQDSNNRDQVQAYKKLEDFLATAFNLFLPAQFEQILETAPTCFKIKPLGAESDETYGLNFSPVIEEDSIQRMIITMQNETELQTLRSEKQNGWSGMALDGIISFCDALLQDTNSLRSHCVSLKNVASENREISESSSDSGVKRQLHNLKGAARLVGLKSLEHSIHRVESLVEQLKVDPQDNKTPRELEAEFHRFGKFSHNVLEVLSLVKEQEQDGWLALKIGLEKMTAETSERMKKPVTLNIMIHGESPSQGDLQKIRIFLQHLITNAIDHGIEDATERREKGKPSAGTIQVSIAVDGSNIRLRTIDDGGGINAQKLWKRAVEQGVRQGPAPDQMSQEVVLELLAEAGLSSKDSTTAFSGRGIGMNAVVHEVKAAGGKVSIPKTDATGTTFEVEWPCERKAK